jgi:predicted MFS family arabinose efflux permease
MARLSPLVMGTFAIGTDAFVIAGILPDIADDLGVSQSAAGQLVTLFAIAYAVGSPVLSSSLARLPRRRVLLLGLAVFVLANIGSAVSPNYAVLAVTRVIAALGAGLYTPNASAAAASSVPPERRGRALALVFGGLTVANVLGVPIGTFLGSVYDWRITLVFVAALGGLAGLGIMVSLRELPPPMATPLSARLRLLGDRHVLAALGVVVVAMTGGFAFYTYIAASLRAIAHFHFGTRDLTYFLFVSGVCGVVGGQLGGRLADRFPGRAVLALSLVAMAVALLVFPLLAISLPGAVIGMVLYGVTSTVVTVPNQHRLASLAPGAITEVMSLNSSALYAGISLAGAVGGALLSSVGAGSLPYAAGGIILAGVLLLVLTTMRPREAGRTGEPIASSAGTRS